MSHIFISYSRKNKACVDRIRCQLEARGYVIWMDDRSLEFSTNYATVIPDAIMNASLFLLCWSKEASESEFVKKEMDIARAEAYAGNLKIMPVMLDNTDLPKGISYQQGAIFSKDCTDEDIAKLVTGLPAELRLPRSDYDATLPLGKQKGQQAVTDVPLVTVPLMRSHAGNAYLVGEANYIFPKHLDRLPVCLQLTRSRANLIVDAYHTLNRPYFCALYITGPKSSQNPGDYALDNYNPCQWQEILNLTFEAINLVGNENRTVLEIFAAAPNAFVGALGMYFRRFWHVNFYNWTGATPAYQLVLDVPRNR